MVIVVITIATGLVSTIAIKILLSKFGLRRDHSSRFVVSYSWLW